MAEYLALGRFLGYLASEVFQRSQANESKPLTFSVHDIYELPLDDNIKSLKEASTNVYVWGTSGVSDEVDASPKSCRWSFSGVWG